MNPFGGFYRLKNITRFKRFIFKGSFCKFSRHIQHPFIFVFRDSHMSKFWTTTFQGLFAIRNILFSQFRSSSVRNCSHEWSSQSDDRYPKLCPRETNRHSWKAGGYPGNPGGSVVPRAAAVTTNDPSLPPPLPQRHLWNSSMV